MVKNELNVFLLIVQAVTEVLNKSHFSLQMGNCPIPVAEHFGLCCVGPSLLSHRSSLHDWRTHLGFGAKVGKCSGNLNG